MSVKNTLASASTINTTGSTTVTFTFPAKADVDSTVIPIVYSTSSTLGVPTNAGLKPSEHIKRPGVFTIGTAPEGTTSNPTNDSNS